MQLNTYVFFIGDCEEAFNFYKSILGGEFESITYFKDGPMDVEEKFKNKVMHVDYRFDGNTLMGSDNIMGNEIGKSFSLSLSTEDADEMDDKFAKLAEGGTITMPIDDTFWGSRFGMLTDKFGINWMFSSPQKKKDK